MARHESALPRRKGSELPTLAERIRMQYGDGEGVATLLNATFSTIAPGTEIIGLNTEPKSIIGIRDGIAIRHRDTAQGARHILAFLLSGDVCNPNPFVLAPHDHVVAAVTPVIVERIPFSQLHALFSHDGAGQRILWDIAERESAGMRDRVVALECRDARQRVVQILSDLALRLMKPSQTDDPVIVPLTQTHLADAAGLTHVHVNRVLRGLRDLELIATQRGALIILNIEGLLMLAKPARVVPFQGMR